MQRLIGLGVVAMKKIDSAIHMSSWKLLEGRSMPQDERQGLVHMSTHSLNQKILCTKEIRKAGRLTQ